MAASPATRNAAGVTTEQRRMHIIRLLVIALWAMPLAAQDNTPANLSEQGRERIQQFAGRLQDELQQAMADGGPVNAIDVCKVQAPAIARELSTDGWQVRRVSLQPRNPDNAADEFERRTLRDFEDKQARGWQVERLAYYKMQQHQQGERAFSEFRYLKAIPTRSLCLTCHGDNIPAEVKAKLDTLYPDDQARGYQLGDIRGAFSLRKRINDVTVPQSEANAGTTVLDDYRD
ncbi:hypothetical protein J2T55_001110 [Methylohalomonas lacus]|uniref:Tll0287-like domain-containing protein n=1 Tax=Methylohalomonas lacus TaxID=398773 RepID=A0AAE3HKV7_9GAMM|nr:DUF3365 domain-containing protein [Methylohalomonas lacus]MCS3903093.1 hypothetical protein [Methylohalomonas lacus]